MDYQRNNGPVQNNNHENNNGLIIAVSILGSIIVIGLIFLILLASGVISVGGNADRVVTNTNQEAREIEQSQPVPDTSGFNQQDSTKESAPTSADSVETMKPVPVEKYMYVGNCKRSVTLRSGAGENYSEIRQVPLADQVYVYEYINSSFAKVVHNGTEGFIKRDYLVDVRPEVWTYNDADAERQVENSLRAFVNGINTGSTDYVYTYYAGSVATDEINTHNSIVAKVESEEILSLNCHSVQRISGSEVTVIRDSVIRVVYKDGSVKDITEKYKYTLDLSNGMRITKLQNIK